METNNLITDKRIANALVYINGDEVNFAALNIEQSIGEHHLFRLVLDYDALKNSFLSNPQEQIALLGKRVTVELQQGDDNGRAYEFRGVIDNTVNEGSAGRHGSLIIEGKSPTVLLERGKRLDIFSNMSLKKVFDEVIYGVPGKSLSCVNNPVFGSTVPFLMQYWESDWEFLQRLSVLSGETLYYTGVDLVFGKHDDFPTMEVTYDREISDIRFGSRLLPNAFTLYQYLAEKHEYIKQSPDKVEHSTEQIDAAHAQSRSVIDEKRLPRLPVALPVEDVGSLMEQANGRKERTAAQTICVTGIAKTCHPRIGRLLKINLPEGLSDADELGTYRVVKVVHSIDHNHHYSAVFEAVPAALKRLPAPDIYFPTATSVQAEVISNNDPQGLGRVLVEFPFANDMRNETWLQVMTPDGGGLVKSYGNDRNPAGIVERNRGFVFIPETGDQVMVGFEFGDPNRPYVMGSLFHGKNAAGGGEKNFKKSIITRSGHTLEFDDNDDSLGITLKDKNGNVIHLDTKGKNIEITAPETITLSAKNVNINADENMNLTSGKNTNQNIGENHILSVSGTSSVSVEKTFDVSVTENMNISVEKSLEETIADEMSLSAGTVTVSADGTLKLASQDEMTLKSGSDVIIAQ
jgi:uncharacterized protein involved in type VI secretion and phage assembly